MLSVKVSCDECEWLKTQSSLSGMYLINDVPIYSIVTAYKITDALRLYSAILNFQRIAHLKIAEKISERNK